jgi:hypothetical protein
MLGGQILDGVSHYLGAFPEKSNRGDFVGDWEIVDADTNQLVTDLLTKVSEVTVAICRQNETGFPLLSATLANGKIELSASSFRFHFSHTELTMLPPDNTYMVGIAMTYDGVRIQLGIHELPIVEGYVP